MIVISQAERKKISLYSKILSKVYNFSVLDKSLLEHSRKSLTGIFPSETLKYSSIIAYMAFVAHSESYKSGQN